jgi:hypothetical protein
MAPVKHLASLAALAFALAACGGEAPAPADPAAPVPTVDQTPPPAPAPSSNTITSQGWGPLKIGMTLAEVTAAAGPDSDPDSVGGADPESCDQFRPANAPEGVLVMMEQGKLTRISLVEMSDIDTDRGFGIGDTAASVKAAYGANATVTPHKYQDAPAEYITVWDGGPRSEPYVQDEAARGVVYEIDGTGNVGAIHAGGPSIQLVEGCS